MIQSKINQAWPDDKFIVGGLFNYQFDAWADLIEGKGEQLDQVQEQVFLLLAERKMRGVTVKKKIAQSNKTLGGYRKYIVASTEPGVNTAIYIGAHGKDLFVSWRAFIKPILNSTLLERMLWITAIISFSVSITRFINIISDLDNYFGNPLMEASGIAFSVFITSLIIEIAIILFVGAQTKGYALAYFFVEPTYFDADDITAMSFAVHYSILRALDIVGIESAKLRLKQNFKTNRRGDSV